MKTTDKTPVIVAAIGGVCALLAAAIGLFNPVVTKLTERALEPPTPTAMFTPTATPIPFPSATALPTPLPTFAVSNAPGVAFVLANNALEERAFFIDGAFVTKIASGTVLVFNVPFGTHQLEDCPGGENPIANRDDCNSQRYDMNENPFDWTLGEGAVADKKVTLVLMNTSNTGTDIYLDGTLARALEANQYSIMDPAPGSHTFQNCPVGVAPDSPDSNCAEAVPQDLHDAVEIWKVGD